MMSEHSRPIENAKLFYCLTALLAGLLTATASWASGKKPSSPNTPPHAHAPAATNLVDGQFVSLEDVLKSWPRLDSVQRYAAIEQIIAAGRFKIAEELVSDLKPKTNTEKAMASLLQGLLRRTEGRNDEAIGIFRELLAANPQFARVRLELAVALFMKQEDDAAKHNFELVLGASNNPELTKAVNRFIDAMHQRRRWTFSTYASLAPSTNFNQGTATENISLNGLQFKVDDHARSKSGVGVYGGASGAYRLPVSGDLDMVVGGGVHTKQFRETKFDDTLVSGEVGPRVRFAWGEVGIYGTVARRWFGGEEWWGGNPFSLAAGSRLNARVRLDQRNVVTGNAACQEKRHDAQPWQDGWNCALSLTNDHYLDIRTFLRVLGSHEKEDVKRPWLSYQASSLGLGAFREFEWGISLYGQLLYVQRDFGADFPGFQMTRADDRYEASVQITKRDWTLVGMAPMLQYTFTRNLSNIELFKYDAHGLNLTMTRTF